MAGNRHGRDPFDDDRTEFIGRDEPTQRAWGGRDDQPTEYIGGAGGGNGRGGAYDPDADFGGGAGSWAGRDDSTRFDDGRTGAGGSGRGGEQGSGQYWAPLTPEERGVDPNATADPRAGRGGAPGYGDDAYAGRGGNYDDRGGAYDDRGADYDDRDRRNRRDDGDDGRKGGFGKGATIIAVTAIIAIVILVALMFRFLSGDDESADPTGTTPPPEPSSTTSETLSPEESTPTSDPMRDELDRLRDEVNSLRETPPAIPGLGGGEVVEATVPEAVGKSPAEVELALRRAGFGDITILDANGNTTNSLSALTGTVATIDPPAGTATTTDQAITITLE